MITSFLGPLSLSPHTNKLCFLKNYKVKGDTGALVSQEGKRK